MVEFEEEVQDHAARGIDISGRLPAAWRERPRPNPWESRVLDDFLRLRRMCGGEVRPGDLRDWLLATGWEGDDFLWAWDLYCELAGQ